MTDTIRNNALLDMQTELITAFSGWGTLPDEVAHTLAAQAKKLHFQKNDTILHEGTVDYHLYCLQSGLWRIYYSTDNGREFIKAFVGEGMFFVAFNAFLQQRPVAFSVQALENSTAIRLPYALFYDQLTSQPAVMNLWRAYMERHFIRHEERERVLLLASGMERYQHFLQEYADLEKRIPQYHIASYLGLTEQSLSRLKASLDR